MGLSADLSNTRSITLEVNGGTVGPTVGVGPQGAPGPGSAAWTALETVTTATVRQAPDGSYIRATTSRTTRATFDATEQGFWAPVLATAGTLENTALLASITGIALLTNVAVSADGALARQKLTKVDATAGVRAMTIPDGTQVGEPLAVEKVDSSANLVNVTGKIRSTGSTTLPLTYQYETLELVWGGTFWEPLAGHRTKSSIDTQTDYRAVRTISPFDPTYGAVGGDTGAQQAALTAALTAGAAFGAAVDLRGQTVRVTDTITAPAGAVLQNGFIHCTGAGKTAVTVTGDNVTLYALTLNGPQSVATAVNSEFGIYAQGASAAAPIKNLRLINVAVEKFGKTAIFLKWVDGFYIHEPQLGDLGYGGIITMSALNGWIVRPKIDNVLADPVFSSNGYCIEMTRNETDSLVTDPNSAHIKIVQPIVSNCPWEGIDTHGGQDIEILGGSVLGCIRGIVITETDNGSNVSTWAPKDVRVIGTFIDSLRDDGTAKAGIIVNGVPGATSADPAADYATGIRISGVVIRRHGDKTDILSGAIRAHNTYGLHIDADIDQPSPFGVNLYYDNRAVEWVGGVVKDAWTDNATVAHAAPLICRDNNNFALIDGVTLVTTGTKAATYLNTDGIYDVGTATAIQLGTVDFTAATTPVPNSTAVVHRFPAFMLPLKPIRAADGTASVPIYSFSAETNTGFYRSAANQLAVAVAGVLRSRWLTTGHLYVDGYPILAGASTTAGASVRLPHGTAPTSPSNGDMWTTTAGMFVRINGVTKTVTLT